MTSYCSKTFGDYDGLGDFYHDESYERATALSIWYSQTRRIPLGKLSHNDVARACRQRVFLKELVPCCLIRLRTDPLQGDDWQGQLADALTYVPEDYWNEHPKQLGGFKHWLRQAWLATEDDDLDWYGETPKRRRRMKP